ncbi:MAG: amino acid adenylation domain-containing protein, partial [Blastocatellia bacterium]|nr:amino acid adenylation domain-containing protein [Blastocatellia bacterium]
MARTSRIKIIDSLLLEERDYWLNRLSGRCEPSGIGLDYPRPQDHERAPGEIEIRIPDELYQKLLKVTTNSPFLIYTALMTALKVCLYKYTGSSAIIVGSPSRRKEGAASNALAILSEIDARASFHHCLTIERKVISEAYSRQDYPYDRLLKDLKLSGSVNKCLLFDIALSLSDLHNDLPEVKNDITLRFTIADDSIQGAACFDSNLFRFDRIERFAGHLVTALRRGLQNPDLPICDLDIMTAEERHEMLVGWNDTERDFPSTRCIHELFEDQADRTPDSIALASYDTEMTYEELDRRANRLAHYLRGRDAGPETLIGIFLERSVEMIVSLLGILKSGAAFVPIDPSYPPDRVAFMLEDSNLSILITRQELSEKLPTCYAAVVCLDSEREEIDRESLERPSSGVTPENLAYVIYTSGSTGQPKGVLLQQGGVCNLAAAQVEAFGVRAADRVLQFASLSFDASVSEIFMALTSGATICLGSKETLAGAPLLELLRGQAISVVTLPPGVLAALPFEDIPALETLIAAGESCPGELAARWSEGRRFFNAYGPTETTVCASLVECVGEYPDGPPIGRPMANMHIFILDEFLNPIPVGVPGELYISGVGLARGYLNDPDVTASRFIPNRFGEAGSRLYKTGDLGRYLYDGSIEFIGRADYQIKLRGLRIELGEIEAVLLQHPAVRESVAIARNQSAGDCRIVAYFTTDQSPPPSSNELRAFLRRKLPDYMVPSSLVVLEAMPLSPNGKIDRRALPEPDDKDSDGDSHSTMLRSPTEEILSGIWADVLELDRVGVNDNFFELGGHSLLGTQIISRVRSAFQIELPMRTLFEAPQVAAQARVIDSLRTSGQKRQARPIVPASREKEIPLSFAQERLWFLDQLEPESTAYNIFASVRLKGAINVLALERSFGEVVRRHESLRTTFSTIDGRPVQSVSSDANYNYLYEDLEAIPDPEREARALELLTEESERRFDLMRGPLFRVALVRLDEEDHIVLLVMHHIVSDGWSLGVLIREVSILYSAYSQDEPSPLPDLPVQYADFSIWQREWLRDEVLKEQLSYWKERLANLPELRLPTDRPRPMNQTFKGARESILLSKETSDALKSLSQRAGVTLFMTLLAAFKCLLLRLTGQEDIVVATGIANRSRGETEGLIGFFVNMLVLRTDLSGNPTFMDLLAREREVTLGAYAHQDLPFARLVEALQPERNLGGNPLFQVVFVLQNAPMPALTLEGLTISPVVLESRTTHFDLTLEMLPTEEGLIGALDYSTDL